MNDQARGVSWWPYTSGVTTKNNGAAFTDAPAPGSRATKKQCLSLRQLQALLGPGREEGDLWKTLKKK